MDDTFHKDFLLTYRTFLPSAEPIIEKLKSAWLSALPETRERVSALFTNSMSALFTNSMSAFFTNSMSAFFTNSMSAPFTNSMSNQETPGSNPGWDKFSFSMKLLDLIITQCWCRHCCGRFCLFERGKKKLHALPLLSIFFTLLIELAAFFLLVKLLLH